MMMATQTTCFTTKPNKWGEIYINNKFSCFVCFRCRQNFMIKYPRCPYCGEEKLNETLVKDIHYEEEAQNER